MLVTDVCRGLLIATVPVAYALGHLTWVHLYIVAFGTGTLAVFFYVAYGGVLPDDRAPRGLRRGQLALARQPRVLVPRRHEPRRRARAASARPVRARARRGLVHLVGVLPRPGRRRRPARRRRHEGGVLAGARWIRGNAIIRAELLGVATLNLFNFIFFALFLLYATRSLHVRPATLGVVLGAASVGTLFGSFVTGAHRAADRRRAGVPDRLLPLPRAADPRAGRGRAALARARASVRRRVPLRLRPDAARHPRRGDHGRRRSRRRSAHASPARSWS